MEQARRATEALARSLINAVSDAIVATDAAGHIQFMNPAAEQMCGASSEAVAGLHIDKAFPLTDPSTKTKAPCALDKILADTPLDPRALLLTNAMGKQIMVRRRGAPTHDSAGQITGAVFIFQDLSSDQTANQERAANSESARLLAGDIAHDLNNAFTGIIGNLSLLKERAGLPSGMKENLTLIERSAQKARQLTLQLLTLAKRD